MTRRVVACVIGTRPEAVKMAPVVHALRASGWADVRVLVTGQHRDLLDPILHAFGIKAAADLDLMRPGQTPADLTARALAALDAYLGSHPPDAVLGQGDTTTVLATALACFYRRVPFGHVEAGLRTGDLREPFPEEMNRVVATRLASVHFAPTVGARSNLLREGVDPAFVHLTGNTVIDALNATAGRVPPLGPDLDPDPAAPLVLVTAHRRDSFGAPIARVCSAVARLHDRHPGLRVLWPVHPNPSVRPVVERLLGALPRVRLCDPLGYEAFVAALRRCRFVMTDSGGVQEEAPALGKPVLVMRDRTERPEAVEAGVAKLVGTDADAVFDAADRLLTDPAEYRAMARGISPYGDGAAAPRIVAALGGFLGVDTPPPVSWPG